MNAKNKEAKNVEETLNTLFQSFENADEAQFLSVTHPAVRTVNIGNDNEAHVFSVEDIRKFAILGLRNAMDKIPGFYARRVITALKHIAVHDLIASAEVDYRMEMPDSVGIHTAYLHLLKVDGKWLVTNIIDRGLEQAAGNV